MWGTLMAGGFGVEWYFGYASPNSDLTCQDFRSRDLFWDQNKHALQFFNTHIPFWEMESRDDLIVNNTITYCLAKEDEVYTVYTETSATNLRLNLSNTGSIYTVKWFNPRNGGGLQNGSIEAVKATGIVQLGLPPSDPDKDWVILISKSSI